MNLCSAKWQMVLVSIHQCQAISSKSSATKPWKSEASAESVRNLWGHQEGDSLFEGRSGVGFQKYWSRPGCSSCLCGPVQPPMAQVIWARAAAVASYQIRARVQNIYLAGEMIQIEMRIFFKWVGSTTN